jgi:hypothetical protein
MLARPPTIAVVRYHILLECDRLSPIYFAAIEANDDDAARLFVAQQWPGERLQIVRQDGDRLVRVRKS